MKSSPLIGWRLEAGLAALLLAGWAASAWRVHSGLKSVDDRMEQQGWLEVKTPAMFPAPDTAALEQSMAAAENPVQAGEGAQGLFSSGLRVAAIGSAYPIPFEATVCPFSGVPQPAVNQLDFDDDGITDDWETAKGLDKFNAADAREDSDGDGFINREEFQYGTEPYDAQSHPPYALKLRFVERKETPFPVVFQGASNLTVDETVFQLNTLADGKTHFRSLGESLEHVLIKEYMPPKEGRPARLLVERGGLEIELIKGRKAVDPESRAELINILDRSTKIVTMGALLSLYNDEYTALSVHENKVVLKDTGTGEVFDIVGLPDGDEESPEDI